MDAMAIGRKLKECRGARTQEEVAKSVGITRSALNMYELGCRIPRDNIKCRLADYYGVSVGALFFGGEFTNSELN